ncbi:class I SAM-dependent methyltransferase [Bacillus spongiae]|uniref:Class I SAM-dependent methyltransferase n=1 Tax=Bacillus spongiae TaxID=2683610 RepID=A0ABU8HC00_9BACI
MNNRWNKVIYKFGSVVYDKFFNTGKFLEARKRIFRDSIFKSEDKILFVGVGTGADLELINHKELTIIAIDYSNDMLDKARAKFKGSGIEFFNMDAQEMDFSDNQFDLVVASLILTVVPDADKCMEEMARVLKPQGKIMIFDKFAPKDKNLAFLKQILRPIIQVFGTDIGRNFETMYENQKEKLSIEEDLPILFNGMYRKIVLRKIV